MGAGATRWALKILMHIIVDLRDDPCAPARRVSRIAPDGSEEFERLFQRFRQTLPVDARNVLDLRIRGYISHSIAQLLGMRRREVKKYLEHCVDSVLAFCGAPSHRVP